MQSSHRVLEFCRILTSAFGRRQLREGLVEDPQDFNIGKGVSQEGITTQGFCKDAKKKDRAILGKGFHAREYLTNVFVQITKYICLNCKMYLLKMQNISVLIAKCICLNCTYICLNIKMYLSKLQNIFV